MGFEWDTYRALLFVHVTSVVIALGATFALPVLQPMAARQGVSTLRFAMHFTHKLEQVVVGPGSLIALLAGIGLIFNERTGYSDSFPMWLAISVLWFLAAAAVANSFQARNMKQAMRILDEAPDDGPMPAELAPVATRIRITG